MILEGRALADKIIQDLAAKPRPEGSLAVIQVGENPASALYILKKEEVAKRLGVEFKVVKLGADISQVDLEDKIEKLNDDSRVRGIILQLPLPSHIDRIAAVSKIKTEKDIDGFHCILGHLRKCLPPTISAIDELLRYYRVETEKKKILIVGAGFLVGEPLLKFWKSRGFDVGVLAKDDSDYKAALKAAQIAVIATGGGRNFKADDFSKGAVVIDASTVADEGRVRGDVELSGWPDDRDLAPVPGGIGPVTVAMLFKNFYDIAP